MNPTIKNPAGSGSGSGSCHSARYLNVDGRSQSLGDAGRHGEIAAGYRPMHDVVSVHHGNQLQRQAHPHRDVGS